MSPRKTRTSLSPRLSSPQTGWGRTSYRNNKLIIAQREPGDAFFDIHGGGARLRSYPRKAKRPPSRCWEKGTSWVRGSLTPVRIASDTAEVTTPRPPQDSGFKKCRQCNLFSQRLPNFGQEFITIGRFLEEGHRTGVQRPFLIVNRISGAEHDDWSGHKICQLSHSFKD